MSKKIGFAGRKVRLKAKIMIKIQERLLKYIGKVKPDSKTHSLIQFIAKHMIGPFPYVMKLDITDTCNLSCKMCYAKNKKQKVSLTNILFILKQIGNVPIRLDLLGGEPLLQKDICKIIKYAKTYTGIQEIVLYTNGTLVTESLAENLSNAGLDTAIVTLISHDSKTHDSFTGQLNSWQKTIDGIKNLVKAGIKTYTFSALHTKNIGDMEHIHQYVTQKLKISPLFYPYIPQRLADPLSPPLNQWHKSKHKILYEYNPEHCDYFKSIISYCGHACLGGSYSISIKADGSVTPCPFIYDISFGNVFEQNIWDIFAKRFKSPAFSEFMSLPTDCVDCIYKKLCAGGCRAGNKILFGSYLTKDHRCCGPWKEPIEPDQIADKLPMFF